MVSDKFKIVLVAAVLCHTLFAAVLHVEKTGNDDNARSDVSRNTPFLTIQAAIDSANDGDTIKVGPGVYNTSEHYAESYGKSRIFINKEITLESTEGRDSTIIEGALHDSEYGLGEDAVRCVCAVTNATIKGFTFRNGATKYGESDSNSVSGGGLLIPNDVSGGVKELFVLDSRFENCSSTRGGGMRRGTAYRTIFKNCYALKNGSAVREVKISFCYFEGCGGVNVVAYQTGFQYCTFHKNTPSSSCIHSDKSTFKVSNCVFASGVSSIECSSINAVITVEGNVFHNAQKVVTKKEFAGSIVFSGNRENVWGAGVMSPVFGDMRPYEGGCLDGTGMDLRSSLEAGLDDEDVMGCKINWTDGPVCPGAFQQVVTPASGRLVFLNNNDARLSADGVPVGADGQSSNYTFATCWPTQYLLKAESVNPNKKISRMEMYVDGSEKSDYTGRPPLDLSDETWITAPPEGTSCKWKADATSNVLWVDDDAVFEGEPNGSFDKPFRVIQDAVTNMAGVRVICVKAGVYNSGIGTNGVNGLARVEIINGGYLRMIGVEGATNTFIIGASDSATAGNSDKLGCGPAAVRCISSTVSGVVQGFTLTGGRTDHKTDPDGTDLSVLGGMGAVTSGSSSSTGLFFVDCIISNNVACRGAIGYGGTYYRCLMTGNKTLSEDDGSLLGSVVANCVCTNNISPKGTIGKKSYCYNSTIVELNPVAGIAYGEGYIYNSICKAACVNPVDPESITGTLLDGFGSTINQSSVLRADPCFRDLEGGDLRIATLSEGVGLGDPNVYVFWKRAGSDFNGNRYKFVNGRVIAGAFQDLAPSVRLGVSAGPASGISRTGLVFFDDEGLEVVAGDFGTRLFAGFSINGEIVPGSGKSHLFLYKPAVIPVPGAELNAVYLTNWYVNAESGDDENRGDTPDTAKKTLEKVLEYVVDGDVVHAAEGDYNEGKMLQDSNAEVKPYLYARAVLPAGVTLVADGSREKTVILGQDDPSGASGCGQNAIRCVRMARRSKLIGFTLRGGKTDIQDRQDEDNQGGGVYAESANINEAAQIINCSIENCRSYRGGGSIYGIYRNCRMIGNTAVHSGTSGGAAGRSGYYYGCYFDKAECISALSYPKAIVCCTFGPELLRADKSFATAFSSANETDSLTIYGTLFCGGLIPNGTAANPRKLVNCAFRSDLALGNNIHTEKCVAAPAESLARLDKDGVPVAGMNPVCDKGDIVQWKDVALDEELDAAGNARVQNAFMDIGCYEADWRSIYSQTIGRRGIVDIEYADPYAQKGDTAEVFLPEGEISGKISVSRKGRYEFPVRITGAGKLRVELGDVTGEFSESGVFKADLDSGDYELMFVYDPADGDLGGAYIGTGGRVNGTLFTVR